VFRHGAAGRVIDAEAAGGSREMQQSALTSIRQWHFEPIFFNGVPAQIVSAAIFVFTNGVVTVHPSPTMSAKQLSPRLGFPCPNALVHHDVAAAKMCKQQLHDVKESSASTDFERLTAHDEYGLALLDAHRLKPALAEFSEAISLAVQVLKPSDPELAYIYLHQAAAEIQSGDPAASEQDRVRAKTSLDAVVENSVGTAQTYYQHLEQQFALPGSPASTSP
jgi:hypothetical protein